MCSYCLLKQLNEMADDTNCSVIAIKSESIGIDYYMVPKDNLELPFFGFSSSEELKLKCFTASVLTILEECQCV